MKTARFQHTATVLKEGRVLVVGGRSTDATVALASVELFEPAANTWSQAAPLHTGRALHTATLMADGRVLIGGGIGLPESDSGAPVSLTALSSTEVFDPKTNSWAAGPDLSEPRSGHSAVLTSEGVWFAGGLRGQRMVLGSTERIDAKLQRHDGPTLVTARAHHTANALGSADEVLIAGGRGPQSTALAETERCSMKELKCSALPVLPEAVQRSVSVSVAGAVVLIGGYSPSASTNYLQRFELAPLKWSLASHHLSLALVHHAATVLQDGSILVSGGETPVASDSSRLQKLGPNGWCLAGALKVSRRNHTATLLKDGRVLLVGGTSAGMPEASTELWSKAAGPCEEPQGLSIE